LEKAVGFHFHIHLDFNLAEFLQSTKGDIERLFENVGPEHFFGTDARCAVCNLLVDTEAESTVSQEEEDEDGVLIREHFYHETCAPTEVLDTLVEDDENEGSED